MFYDGTVYLAKANHRDAADVEKSLFHELFGNAAVYALFNDNYDAYFFLNTLLERLISSPYRPGFLARWPNAWL